MSDSADPDFEMTPRRAGFLARYPRKFKLAVTALLLIAIAVLPDLSHVQMPGVSGGPRSVSTPVPGMQNMPTQGNKIETEAAAPALNDQDDHSIKLISAPDSRVAEDSNDGPLPRISEDGLHPWQVYARPFNQADKRPRIALIITDLGLARAITDQAISQMPPTVTLSFSSQAPAVGAWNERARQDGHETLLQIPMEPFDYPHSDPGPETLLTSLPNSDNLVRLTRILRRASGYVGVTTVRGSRFSTDSTKFAPVISTLHDRGLMILDARAAPHGVVTEMAQSAGVPVATVTERLDGDLSPEAIASALDDLEKTARQNGRAIGITAPTPVMITQLQAWLKDLPQRGIALAPISAMVQ